MHRTTKAVLFALVAYASASLFHHVHNATFLSVYPNMPQHLSMLGVYMAWAMVTAIGIVGYALLRLRYSGPGLLLLAIYGACGLDGLAHYFVAEFTAHSMLMHLSILAEVVTGLVLIGVCVRVAMSLRRSESHSRIIPPL